MEDTDTMVELSDRQSPGWR